MDPEWIKQKFRLTRDGLDWIKLLKSTDRKALILYMYPAFKTLACLNISRVKGSHEKEIQKTTRTPETYKNRLLE